MSGYRSGKRLNVKKTTGSQHGIDIRKLKKEGNLRPNAVGIRTWPRYGKTIATLHFRMGQDRMVLFYRRRLKNDLWETIQQTIFFAWIPCTYGGQRTWFLCPQCNKRVTSLYADKKQFLCRHCCNLTYISRNQEPYERLMEKARAIRKRLGGGGNLAEYFPEKPKYMHWKTYLRLQEKAEQARHSCLLLMAQHSRPRFNQTPRS
ncbi:MAG TPA: hypothetical protein PKZ42_08435 [Syntrophales bacterium]|nr:hypothetical protein [Syntrophales bacterium]